MEMSLPYHQHDKVGIENNEELLSNKVSDTTLTHLQNNEHNSLTSEQIPIEPNLQSETNNSQEHLKHSFNAETTDSKTKMTSYTTEKYYIQPPPQNSWDEGIEVVNYAENQTYFENNYINNSYQEPAENFISLDELGGKIDDKRILTKKTEVIEIDSDDEDKNGSKVPNEMNNSLKRKYNEVKTEYDEDHEEEEEDENNDDVIFVGGDNGIKRTQVQTNSTFKLMEIRQEPILEAGASGAYECHLCNKRVASSYNLKRHMMIHTGERPFGCDLCEKKFREFSDLKKHRRVHSHDRNYKCMICQENPPAPNNPTKCINCDRAKQPAAGTIYSELIPTTENCEYIEGSSTKKGYSCPVCDRIFGSRHNLKRHFMIHSGEKPFSCTICSRSFRELSTLKKHTMTHNKLKFYKCEMCHEDFNNYGTYTAHNLRNHREHFQLKMNNESEMNYDESNTPPPTTSYYSEGISEDLYGENSFHDDSVEYDCNICDQKFKNFDAHLELHSSLFSFHCYICKKTFKEEEKLNAHLVTHDDEERIAALKNYNKEPKWMDGGVEEDNEEDEEEEEEQQDKPEEVVEEEKNHDVEENTANEEPLETC